MTMADADTTTEGALAGIRVLELANFMAGPFCGMLLADMCAEVIKVENPAVGDYTRTTPPFVNGESAGFLALNRNKKSVTLNLKAPAGRALFLELAATADVVLENFRPGTMTDLGVDLCQAIGKPKLEHDPRFATNADRMANVDALAEIIEAVLVTESSQHWLTLFEPHFPCGLLNTYEQVLADPHLQARGFLLEMEHPQAGAVRSTGFVPRLSGTPARIYRPAPTLGQHNEEILGQLGRNADAVHELKAAGVDLKGRMNELDR